VLSLNEFNILTSYFYARGIDCETFHKKYKPFKVNLFLDSGAFTVRQNGQSFELSKYADFVEKNNDFVSVAANVDIGTSEEIHSNFMYLRKTRGLKKVFPIYQPFMPLTMLEMYLKEYQYVGLGTAGFNIGPPKQRKDYEVRYMFRAHEMADKIGNCGYHGFAVTQPKIMKAFPWWSCDSTSWLMGAKFGKMNVFDPLTEKMMGIHWGNKTELSKYHRVLSIYRAKMHRFHGPKTLGGYEAGAISGVSYLALAKAYSKQGGVKRVYLASAETSTIMNQVYMRLKDIAEAEKPKEKPVVVVRKKK
jgi:hypothetical protein